MNNPFEYVPDGKCEEAFRGLVERIEALRQSDRQKDVDFCRELEEGKMLGVLIAKDDDGVKHTLYAFPSQLGNGGFHFPRFVGPVFDYLKPDGYFKTKERDISRQNAEIAEFEDGTFSKIKSEYKSAKAKVEAEISDFRDKCRQSKLERDARRKSGLADEDELASMIRQSQFEKAELYRLKGRLEADMEPLTLAMRKAQSRLDSMKEKRRNDSEALQEWLFTNFKLLNARGESKSLSEIFADTTFKIPPSGAGECCGPKLLQAAYLQGWQPVSMAEYWYGKPKGGEVRIHGRHYPACRGKCLPVLSWMLQGLDVEPPLDIDKEYCGQDPEILFENHWFCIVNKPSGMLSVPGKGRAVSVEEWLTEKYGQEREVRLAHRLDQDTSGLLIATFGELSVKVIQMLFAMRRVKKTYVAELDGDFESCGVTREGRISLPLSPDWLDRPRQKVDFKNGKEAVTDYEFVGISGGRSRVMFLSAHRTHPSVAGACGV